ncbi:MAG: family 20 glycosylhydrolase, partial [Vulcanimicrobiaceae bacterium]
MRCRLLVLIAVLFGASFSRAGAVDASLLVPQPRSMTAAGCRGERIFTRPLRLPPGFDAGARELIDERWTALGIPRTQISADSDVAVRIGGGMPEAYSLQIPSRGAIAIRASDSEGVFDAAMTLAQLARPAPHGLRLACARIDDAPALRWRIVSDDVSRGPLPTMRYFKERIRGLAALKINGYSIYMEHVFVDAAHPFVAPADGITPQQLRELRDYAARFHVALIPEQQTLAHMHGTLRWERYSAPAEISHGWTFSPANPQTYAYLTSLLREVLTATGKVPFIHLGADEPQDLGHGQALSTVFVSHVNRVAAIVRPFGARPMIWDDAVQRDPSILDRIPKSTVIVDFHYGVEKTYEPYIAHVAAKGFAQMVSPAAWNWNELYPLLDVACDNIGRFVADGKRAHVLGMFLTVWHDDGESLYESTWYPLAFAAASAWQHGDDINRYAFDRAF